MPLLFIAHQEGAVIAIALGQMPIPVLLMMDLVVLAAVVDHQTQTHLHPWVTTVPNLMI